METADTQWILQAGSVWGLYLHNKNLSDSAVLVQSIKIQLK